MERPFRIYRTYREHDMRHLEQVREVIRRSRDLLTNHQSPDTFAGRKTQEPFPKQDEEIEGYLSSNELQPPTK